MKFIRIINSFAMSARLFLFLFILMVSPTFLFAKEGEEVQRQRTEISPAKENESPVEAVADDIEYFKEEKKIIGRGNVVVTQDDTRLQADYAEIFTETKKAFAKGHVTIIRQGKDVLSGDKGFYDFENHQASLPNGRAESKPWYMTGEQIEQVSKNQVNIYEGTLTTCPWTNSHYDVKAKRIVMYPGDKLIAWNVTFRILKFPVFWWPYMVIPLDQEAGPFELHFGQSKSFGNYALIGKTISLLPQTEDRELKTKVHVDYRAKRKTALGDQTWYHFKHLGDGDLKLYWLKDPLAPDPFYVKPDDHPRLKERYRVSWRHRKDFDEGTNLIMQYNEFSDNYMLHDFFDQEFDKEPIPQTFATFTHTKQHYGILVNVQKQANNFDNVLERLPEVRFNWNSTEIPKTGLYYDSQTSYVNLHQISHTQTTDPEDDSGRKLQIAETTSHLSKVDTYHEISYPMKLLRYYELTPSANARWDFYNHNAAGDDNKTSNNLGLGTEASTRFYRFFDIPKGSIMGIKADRIRHVVKPIITYTGIRQASTRPYLLHPLAGAINVSDSIQFGIENRLQTKSKGTRIDVVSLNTYANYSFNDSNRDSRMETGTVQLILRPYSWFQMQSDVSIDVKQHRKTGSTTDLAVRTKYVDLSVNHRFVFTTKDSIASDKYFQRETNVVTLNGDAKLNERWRAGGYFRFEAMRHSWREYEWRIERDLHDWILTIGENIRHSDINWMSHEAFFEIQLKALPGLSFNSGQRATFSEARIGETVSGANTAPPPPSLLKS